MQILWIASHFRTGKTVGSLRTWMLSQNLIKKGHRLAVIVPNVDPLTARPRIRLRTLFKREDQDGVRLILTASTPNIRNSFVLRLGYFLSQALCAFLAGMLEPRPDIVVAANLPITNAVCAFFLARLRRLPFVLEVRDLPTEAALVSGYLRQSLLTRLTLRLEKELYRYSDHIITVSAGMKRMIGAYGIRSEMVTTVPNGYEELLFEPQNLSRNIREEFSWGSKKIILYAGTLGHLPDVGTLLQTADLVKARKDILFVIIGAGQKEKTYRDFVASRQLENCVFLGPLPRNEIPAFCQAADICVNLFPKHPFWGIMFGNKNFDYLGSGTAYVYAGSEPSDTGDLICEAKAGRVVPPEDPEALRDTLLELLSQPDELLNMGARGKKFVVERYSRQLLARDFEKTLLGVVDR